MKTKRRRSQRQSRARIVIVVIVIILVAALCVGYFLWKQTQGVVKTSTGASQGETSVHQTRVLLSMKERRTVTMII